jgi:hypothetical protein
MTLASPVWELARELREMRGLFATSHRLDGARLAGLLPEFRGTPLDQVLIGALPVDIRPDQPMRAGGLPVLAE